MPYCGKPPLDAQTGASVNATSVHQRILCTGGAFTEFRDAYGVHAGQASYYLPLRLLPFRHSCRMCGFTRAVQYLMRQVCFWCKSSRYVSSTDVDYF